MSAFTDRWKWRFLPRATPLEEAIDRINERMRALDDILARWADDLEHGPIPGAYLPIAMSATQIGGLTTGVKDLVPVSFDGAIRAIYAFTPPAAGTLTIDVNNGSTSVLATPLSLNGSVTLNDAVDFSSGVITPPDLNFEIDSIDAGTPEYVRVLVILQNVTNVEDQ